MARARRITVPFFPHYVRQSAATPAFTDEADFRAYLYVLRRATQRHHLSLLGYALEASAVHLLVLPVSAESLSRAVGQVNREYALWRHIRTEQNEPLWSGRFQSCAFDRPQLWSAMRFVDGRPTEYSSRGIHESGEDPAQILDLALWREVYGAARWRRFADLADPEFAAALSEGIATGQPLVQMAQTRAAAR
jgi:hypothetical protein